MKKLGIAFVLLLLAAPALGQEMATDDSLGVSVAIPAGWEAVEDDDRAVFNFRHEDHSQIEVIGNELMTADVAEVFFTHFHDTLQSSDFMQVGREDKAYGETNGTETVYTFEHSGVVLKVAVFQFVRDTTAWIAVGYMQDDQFDAHVEEFHGVVSGLTFAE